MIQRLSFCRQWLICYVVHEACTATGHPLPLLLRITLLRMSSSLAWLAVHTVLPYNPAQDEQ
jgi:hypothetical protein